MYDVIIVGARCAGSPTGLLLARAGYRVLLVDRASFPSEMPLSTHYIWPPGVARLREWAVLDAVADHCPPVAGLDIDFGPFHLAGGFPAMDGQSEPSVCHSPRRIVLDQLLVEAAVKAGAELRERFTVEELLVDNGQVVGVRGSGSDGRAITERATVVVGADGPNSVVARLVDAVEYDTHPPIDGTCWSYWSGVDIPWMEFYPRHHVAPFGWNTGDGLALIGVNWPAGHFGRLGNEVEGGFLAALDSAAPALAARAREGTREERFHRGSVRNFLRRPYGPGWALVGDAGYNRTPFTAEGISDAFRDAERLAAAIDDGLSGRRPLGKALGTYEQHRNEAVKPFYDFTRQMAAMEPPSDELVQLLVALQDNAVQRERFLGIFAQIVSPTDFFSPENVGEIMAGHTEPE